MFAKIPVIRRVSERILRAHGVRGASCLFALSLLAGCSSSTDLPPGVITITTGQEADAWTLDPAVQNVTLDLVQTTGRTTLSTVPAPTTEISLGTDGPPSAIASFEATGFDADSNAVLRGFTMPYFIFGFAAAQLTLFMGRNGEMARAPGELLVPRQHPQVAILAHTYLLISGGDGTGTDPTAFDAYDMRTWSMVAGQPALPTAPESWAVTDPNLLLIDHNGALWLNIDTSVRTTVVAPSGLDFGSIVGGETLSASDDTQYIVGATRTSGEPTDQVLRVDTDGTLHLLRLSTARLGAAAAIVDGQLLVVGGSEDGAGAEVTNAGGTAFIELAFPSDARRGAAMIVPPDTKVAILAGGRDPKTDEVSGFRTLDLECSEDCSQSEIAKADFAFDRPRLFALNERQLLAVGEAPDTGETKVFTFDTGVGHALDEVPLRTPRRGASAFLLPNGQVGVLGGKALNSSAVASSLEVYFPQP